MVFEPCNDSCQINFNSRLIEGPKSYFESLNKNYVGSANEGLLRDIEGGAFGASKDYHHIENSTESGQNMFMQSDVSCCIYNTTVHFMSTNSSSSIFYERILANFLLV